MGIVELHDIKENQCYYLFHTDYIHKPSPFANIYIKVEKITKMDITVSCMGGYFFDSKMKKYSTITFNKHFYGIHWHLT